MSQLLLLVAVSPIALPFSFLAYRSAYAIVRALPLVVALVMMVGARRDRVIEFRWGAWVLLTYVFDLTAWVLSATIGDNSVGVLVWASGFRSVGFAGFPIRALELPSGAMGSDIPDPSQWWVVWSNLAFWAAVAGIVVRRISKIPSVIEAAKRLRGVILWTCALILQQITLAMFMHWFD